MTPIFDDIRLLSEHDAARVLGVKPATLRRWRWAGRGPGFHKIGRAVRYRLGELANFIDDAARRSTTDTGRGPHG